jgi:hypothetical protein
MNTITREQATPIQEQINSLMNSLSTQNTQLKQEVARLKRKCQEAIDQLAIVCFNLLNLIKIVLQCQKELDGERRLNNDNYLIIKLEESSASGNTQTTNFRAHELRGNTPSPANSENADGIEVKKEPMNDASNGHDEVCVR